MQTNAVYSRCEGGVPSSDAWDGRGNPTIGREYGTNGDLDGKLSALRVTSSHDEEGWRLSFRGDACKTLRQAPAMAGLGKSVGQSLATIGREGVALWVKLGLDLGQWG
ncbi:unnamed protein product, partial [Ectocarpus fasciculatus]